MRDKAILGVFDEGCMGMFNAIIPDSLLNPLGVFKERLSQSALYFGTQQVESGEAQKVRDWLNERGMRFHTGSDHDTELTDAQILDQCRMYIAAMRIADDYGCDAIGIQYQQGLNDLLPASDLAEGMLNDSVRPPVYSRDGKRELFAGRPLTHFNEVDECAAVDGLLTDRIHRALVSRSKTRCTICAGLIETHPERSTMKSGCWKSAGPCLRLISTMAGPTRKDFGSRRCISRPAAAQFEACRNLARWSGRAFMSRTIVCGWTLDELSQSLYRPKKPSGAGMPRPRNGRSCTRCSTA